MLGQVSLVRHFLLGLHLFALATAAGTPVPSQMASFCMEENHHGCHEHTPLPPPQARSKSILAVGDSVSMGYTPLLAQRLAGTAEVLHVGQTTASLNSELHWHPARIRMRRGECWKRIACPHAISLRVCMYPCGCRSAEASTASQFSVIPNASTIAVG